MKNKLVVFGFGLIAPILLAVCYLNSLMRVEYENFVDLPYTSKVVYIDSEWYIPRNITEERRNRSILVLTQKEFIEFLKANYWKPYEDPISESRNNILHSIEPLSVNKGYYLDPPEEYPGKLCNLRRWIKVIYIPEYDNKVVIELITMHT